MLHHLKDIWPFSRLFTKKIKLPRPELLVPEFELGESLKSGEYTYNPEFYAKEATAAALTKRFNALVYFLKPIQDVDRMAPPQWTLRFSDGLEVSAGALAKFFAMYPEKDYPGVGFHFGINLIAMERAEKAMGIKT